MLKKMIITALVMIVSLHMLAKFAELNNFIIGGYTGWRASEFYWGYGTHLPYGAASPGVFFELKECGYNSAIANVSNPDPDLSAMLYNFDLHEQDAMLIDKSWDPRPTNTDREGVYGMSLSNYQMYEAEFSSMGDPVPEQDRKDKYYYCSLPSDRVGIMISPNSQIPGSTSSGDKVWFCDRSEDEAGYAINDLRYRFPTANNVFTYLNEEFFFHHSGVDSISNYMLDNDYLDFKVAFRLPEYDRDIAHPINMLQFEICGRP
ncbi:MAG: hypothetical protein K0B87_03845 [Candidatus Syntrophosphaera sp.]|nr:hypothetical protein [Candidatus Syntrophosphaera sp.]